MRPLIWTKPDFRELNLSAEIGMYFEDADFMPTQPPSQQAAERLELEPTKQPRDIESA